AAGAAHVAHEQLEDGRGADELGAEAVLGPAQGVREARRALATGVLRQRVGDLEELPLRDPADLLHHLRRVARVVSLEYLEDRSRMLEGVVPLDVRVGEGRPGCAVLITGGPGGLGAPVLAAG